MAGEAGIGKSRLLLEFRRGLAEAGEDATWLEGQCVSFGQSIPFLPIVDQLRRNFGIEELDGEPEIIAKIEHGMRRMGGLEPQIPYLRYLLGVDPGDPRVVAIDAAARRARILRPSAPCRCAARRSARWCSSSRTCTGWTRAARTTSRVSWIRWRARGILLLLTYRIGYAPPFGSRSFYTTLTLHALSDEDTLTMAGGVLGSADFPPELREALMAKAEGVPLYVEEVAKTLLDVGVLRRENGGYRLVRRLEEAGIPDTIQGIIMARLDRLGEDGKRTVQLASVIGRQFLKRLLGRIAGLTHELDGLLGELKTLEIVYELGLLPEPAYIFKHAVIQDVAYQSLLVQRRRDLHRAVGQRSRSCTPTGSPITTRSWPITSPRARCGPRPSPIWFGPETRPGTHMRTRPPSPTMPARSRSLLARRPSCRWPGSSMSTSGEAGFRSWWRRTRRRSRVSRRCSPWPGPPATAGWKARPSSSSLSPTCTRCRGSTSRWGRDTPTKRRLSLGRSGTIGS